MMILKFIPIVYLGSYCNKDCSYCDRGYIKDEIGDTRLDLNDIPQLLSFLDSVIKENEEPLIAFHGGEPFLYIEQMKMIMDHFISTRKNPRFSILTNATLIKRNVKFLYDYGKYLNISISYDFTRMDINRGYIVDIKEALSLLEKNSCQITQLQWVIDMTDKRCFDLDVLKSITDLYGKYDIGLITLIPMRHVRGKAKFRSIIDLTDVQDFMRGFMQFVQMLYVLRIKVSIDGHLHEITKDYFNDHKQIILSPDGYIYPEFDFLDYQVKDARIGNWKTGELSRVGNQDEILTLESCKSCSQYGNCGIKYLYKLFDETPSGKCETFYQILDAVIQHNGRLNKYKNLIQAVQ